MAGRKGVGLGMALAMTALIGCAGGYGNQDQLDRRVDQFNNQVRWGRYFTAAEFVHVDHRDEWLDTHRNWRNGDLRIADWEVVDSTPGQDGESVVVRVVLSWYRMSQSEIQTTMLAQRWRRVRRLWQLESEEVEEGTPL